MPLRERLGRLVPGQIARLRQEGGAGNHDAARKAYRAAGREASLAVRALEAAEKLALTPPAEPSAGQDSAPSAPPGPPIEPAPAPAAKPAHRRRVAATPALEPAAEPAPARPEPDDATPAPEPAAEPAPAQATTTWAAPPPSPDEVTATPPEVPPGASPARRRRRRPGETAPDHLLRAPESVDAATDDFLDGLVRRVQGDR